MRWLLVALVLLLASCTPDRTDMGVVTGKRYFQYEEAFHLAYIMKDRSRNDITVPYGDYAACHVGQWIVARHKRFGPDRAACAPNPGGFP